MAMCVTSMRRCSGASLGLLVFLGGLAAVANANAFLGRSFNQNATSGLSDETEHSLLAELEVALGSGHRHATEKRLQHIEKMLSPTFAAMTKNENGKLDSAGAGYVLHRAFVQRHGWFIKALEPAGDGHAGWESSSPMAILQERVPDHIQTLFENRLGQHGLGLKEIAVLASTIEHLIHSEALTRLRISYAAMNISQDDVLSHEETINLLDMYMAIYIVGHAHPGELSTLSPKKAKLMHSKILDFYPTWPDTQQFLRDIHHSIAPKRDYLYFNEVESIIAEIGERYGQFQDVECRQFKDWLVAVEDKSVGGAGRVRVADFYGQALNNGKWQFSESVDYLRNLGALDESDAANPRVIIPNYIAGGSNCIASSAYYSVCCMDECEGILGQLEKLISAPEASPSTILSMIPKIASATVAKDRSVSAWMQQRLHEVAQHHGGVVPLHGRLFAQWLHFAYPRECSFPHVAGTTAPVRLQDMIKPDVVVEFEETANETVMKSIFDAAPEPKPRIAGSEALAHEESGMWSMHEELVVQRPAAATKSFSATGQGFVMIVAVLSLSFTLVQYMKTPLASLQNGKGSSAKYYV